MTWRVTHVDHHQRRRQVVLEAGTRAAAESQALLQFGAAVYLSAIRLARKGV